MRDQNANNRFVLNLRAGDIVEVRSKEEIFSTLGKDGRLDQLPFMPEMLKYCGRRFRVFKRADKTCDTIGKSGSRRMYNAVHLQELRCDGESHGGCQAGCLLFWKEAWLKRVEAATKEFACNTSLQLAIKSSPEIEPCNCTETKLSTATRRGPSDGPEGDVFSCQATELISATFPLPWWDLRQYTRDILSRNVRLTEFVRVIAIAIFNAIQRFRHGRSYPFVPTPNLTKTPAEILNLIPGELVQVKSKEEIIATLDRRGKNRGLWFDVEMITYCRGQFKVLRRVEKIIDEKTGKMRRLPNDCVVLDGVFCRGDLSRERLFCPRSITPYWREIWLRRADNR
jgi:hypothetical protein